MHRCRACARGYHCCGRSVWDLKNDVKLVCECDCRVWAGDDADALRGHIASVQFAIDHGLSVEEADRLSDEVDRLPGAPTIALYRAALRRDA